MSATLNLRRTRRAVLGLLASAMFALPAAAQPQAEEAAAAMSAWLRLIDDGRGAESWDGLAAPVQGMVTREAWDAGVRQGRAPFAGAVAARALDEARTVDPPTGAPDGVFLRLQFATRFASGKEATETVVTMNGGDGWRAAGYFIAPRQPRADYSAPADAPYTALQVTVSTPAGHTLAGTLTLPKNASGPVPAVVLISGSGSQDRDAATPYVPGYRFFAQIADTLGRRGIAVLRLDDRGWGASGGDVSTATTEDLAADTRAAVEWLRARAEVDPARIVLAGHSEGAVIAPMLAVADPRMRAVVLLAGPSWSGRRIMDFQLRDALAAQGLAGAALDSTFAAAAAGRDVDARAIPWVRWYMEYDPLPAARRLRVPVLVLHGGTDRQVTAEQAEELGAAILAGGGTDVTVTVYPELNHLFVHDPAGTANPAHYAALPSKQVPAEVLGALADWLADRLSR